MTDAVQQHQRELEAARWLGSSDLAKRWGIAKSTVLDIPRDELPYLEFGRGLKLRRRKYNPDDVAAFERRRYPAGDPRREDAA